MTSNSSAASDVPIDQVAVLLGASNLSLAWPRIMSIVQTRFRGATHVYTAHGMGRSYLFSQSAFGFRKLPGIFRCKLWNALPSQVPTGGTYALITDLGNDLLYGSSAIAVAKSAEESISRLRSWSPDCRIVLTGPPVDSVHQLGWLRFLAARLALFPLTKLTLDAAKSETAELNAMLLDTAKSCDVTLVAPAPEWYGLDPIHIKRRYQKAAFTRILQPWFLQTDEFPTASPISPTLKQRPLAETRWVCGKVITTPQPAIHADGVAVFAY